MVADKLAKAGVEVFCPLLKRKKLWSDRWKWVEEPLFRSYCFVRLEDRYRDQIFSVPGVVRYVFYCGRPAIIRENEMNLLKNWLIEYDHESIQTETLNVNDRIRIRSGALIDQEAEVLEKKGNYALLLLEDLGLQVRVDLRRNIIEKLQAS